MSRFNQTILKTPVINKAGGKAYKESAELRLLSLLATSFAENKAYGNTLNELDAAIQACKDKEFVAKALIYIRTEFGMRSITHAGASLLSQYISGASWGKDFYDKIVYRPDDMTEIMAFHKSKGWKFPASMKKGFASAFNRFNEYSLAKYKGENKNIKLVDVVNIVHPSSKNRNDDAISKLVNGTLKQKDTWEDEMVKVGQTPNITDSQKSKLISDKWYELLSENKLGYFALLRNVRNILTKSSTESAWLLADQLTNKESIKRSLVLPFRYQTAIDTVLNEIPNSKERDVVLRALIEALDISLDNMPEYKGKTAIILDVSGSMSGKPSEIASLFTASLMKSTLADLIIFANDAKYVNGINTMDTTYSIAKALMFAGGGTNFTSAIRILKNGYDRIFVLSDMQGWLQDYMFKDEYLKYKSNNPKCKLYSFDLAGYGTLQFPENDVYCVAGFSEKVFDIISLMEEDKNAFVNKVKNQQYW